jgi:hypothetical protein
MPAAATLAALGTLALGTAPDGALRGASPMGGSGEADASRWSLRASSTVLTAGLEWRALRRRLCTARGAVADLRDEARTAHARQVGRHCSWEARRGGKRGVSRARRVRRAVTPSKRASAARAKQEGLQPARSNTAVC